MCGLRGWGESSESTDGSLRSAMATEPKIKDDRVRELIARIDASPYARLVMGEYVALSTSGNSIAWQFLVDNARASDSLERRHTALRLLGSVPTDAAKEVLLDSVNDSDPIVRRAAMVGLARRDLAAAFPLIAERVQEVADPEDLRVLAELLEHVGSDEARRLADRARQSPHWRTSTRAERIWRGPDFLRVSVARHRTGWMVVGVLVRFVAAVVVAVVAVHANRGAVDSAWFVVIALASVVGVMAVEAVITGRVAWTLFLTLGALAVNGLAAGLALGAEVLVGVPAEATLAPVVIAIVLFRVLARPPEVDEVSQRGRR